MICPYCKKEAVWTSNDVVYGKRYGKSFMCYFCSDCDAYVGCHNNTTQPLGTMANSKLRKLRMLAHASIDPIWKSKKMSRRAVYTYLSDVLGYDVHIGNSDENMCEEIIKIAKESPLLQGESEGVLIK